MSIVFLNVPYLEKDEAKGRGAKWDKNSKRWYIESSLDLEPFRRWLPDSKLGYIKTDPPKASLIEGGITLTEYLGVVSKLIKQELPDAKWIRAEVSKIDKKGGHCYLELVDSGDGGEQRAKCNAVIWADKVEKIFNHFEQQTGSSLQVGMKILLQGVADLHVLYGLKICIENIDPTYTIGDLLAKLNDLRKKLQDEKIYAKNKQLSKPKDFTKVAVISPSNAAGLGDFRREADLLVKYGLCKFTYHDAIFQGKTAATEIPIQIAKVMNDHQQEPYDVLVIIRGGGAPTDLAWLNDYAIACAVCHAAIPVFSGIGHERDSTIIDEISCGKFDTPSKVIKHIWNIIIDNAMSAQRNSEHIFERAKSSIDKNQKALNALFTVYFQTAADKISMQKMLLQRFLNQTFSVADRNVDKLKGHVKYQIDEIMRSALSSGESCRKRLLANLTLILERWQQIDKLLVTKLQHLMQLVDLANPMRILQRGFALVRSKDRKTVTSKIVALQVFKEDRELKLLFVDGDLTVTDIEQK